MAGVAPDSSHPRDRQGAPGFDPSAVARSPKSLRALIPLKRSRRRQQATAKSGFGSSAAVVSPGREHQPRPRKPTIRRLNRSSLQCCQQRNLALQKKSRRLKALLIRAALLSVSRLCAPRLQSKPTISTQFAPFPAGYLPISVRAPLASSIA